MNPMAFFFVGERIPVSQAGLDLRSLFRGSFLRRTASLSFFCCSTLIANNDCFLRAVDSLGSHSKLVSL